MAKPRPTRNTSGRPVTSSQARTALEACVPVLVHLATPWMLVAVVELGLGAAIPSTALRSAQLAIGARLGLAGYGLVLLAADVCVVGAPLLLLTALGRSDLHPVLRWTSRSLKALVLWIAVLLYGASWASYWTTGAFLDREALVYWLPEPVQIFHWVYPPLALGVIALTLLTALLLGWWVPRWIRSRSLVVRRHVVLAGASALILCGGAALLGELAYGREITGADGSTSPYVVARDDRAGPLLHAAAELRSPLVTEGTRLATVVVRQGIEVIRRPIISMERYLAGIDRSHIKPLNVVMIQIESLRSDQLRAYGGTRDVLPNVDALARGSKVFTNAYVQASHSNYADPVPLSSHYPLRSSVMYMYPPNPTYPRVLIYEILKGIGYKTAIFSSQNEDWGGMTNYHRPESLDRFFHAATFSGPTYAPWEDIGFANWVKQTSSAGSVDDRYTVGEAMRWLDTVGSSPFFIHMNLQSSHLPYVVPPDFPRRFGPKALDFAIVWASFPRDKISIVKDRYADSLFYEDTQIGRLFEDLRRRGLWDNTLIIVGGDNGEAFYEHGFAAHASSVFNEVVKVPMIMRVPGSTPGSDDRPAMFLDVPPSVLDVLGLPAHPSFQGVSLFEARPNPDRSVFTMVHTIWAHQVAMVRSGFKVLYTERERRYLVFDLVHDPGETINLADSRPDLVDKLGGRLQVWREEQLNYYADITRHTKEYPPILKD